MWPRVIDRTFNQVSVDGDTSTNDMAIVLSSQRVPADAAELEAALEEVCGKLARKVARDGEGATKLITVRVTGGRNDAEARAAARAVAGSMLVKAAVHGADPNWGRVAMAIGKCSDHTDIDQGRVVIRFGAVEVYPKPLDPGELRELSAYMRGDTVEIHVSLNTGTAAATVWGCDLSDGYVRINADYTT